MIWLGAGSDFTTGTLQTSWGTVGTNRATGVVNLADSTSNELYITGIQLELGSKATDFHFEPYGKVESKCQRYYYRVDNTGIPTFLRNDGSTSRDVIYPYPTTMRASPTVSTTPNSGTFSNPYPSPRRPGS